MHGGLKRESIWTNSLAVGSRQYIEQNQDKFGKHHKTKILTAPSFPVKRYGQIRFKNNSTHNSMVNPQGEDRQEDCAICENQNAYKTVFDLENWILRGKNDVVWNESF